MQILESLRVSTEAVRPFLIYLGLGFFAVRAHIADETFMNRLNKFVFTLIFPFMTFWNVYNATPETLPSPTLLIFAGAGILVLEAVLLLTVPRIVKENPRRGVVIQAITRSNFALYGVPMTLTLFPDGGPVAGVVLLEVVTIFNVTSVIILEMFNGDTGGKVDFRALPLKLLKNPLLQGCLAGLLFFALGWKLPAPLEKPVHVLADTASPIAMITLGGTLSFAALRKNGRIVSWVMLIRLILLPTAALLAAVALGLRGVELFLVLMVFGTPIATASYPMAANMGGDGELAGQLVFVSTVISLATIFGFIFALSRIGLLA